MQSRQTVDADSNAIWVNGSDTSYIQTVSAARKPDFMSANAIIISNDKEYKYNPHFRGSIIQYLEENMRYPKEAIEKGTEGKVILTFDIDEHGNISNIKVGNRFRSTPDSLLINEAIRLVKNMPPWQPAKSREDGVTPIPSFAGLTIPFDLY